MKEALQYLIELGNIKREKIGEQEYSTQPLHLIEEPKAETVHVRTLSGLVDYIKSDFDHVLKNGDGLQLLIHVVDPTTVQAFTQFTRDKQRNLLLEVDAHPPEFEFNEFYDAETFNIGLQSAFLDDLDRKPVLQCVGNIREEQVKNSGDDGVTQTVIAKVGIAQVATAEVPNPVTLKPYRTFVEVDQPSSEFVLRLKDGPRCALFEADGGAWKLQAMDNIRDYLMQELNEQIDAEKVIILS